MNARTHLVSFSICLASLAVPCFGEGLKVAELSEDREVKYSTDIYPMLKKNCVACHNTSRDEGGVILESVEKMQASDVEDILVAGKPDASKLFALAAHIEEPVMPPEDNEVAANNLDPQQLALLKRWIEAGAPVDNPNPGRAQYQWQPLPPHLKTVYASAMTEDGRLAVSSFGNRVSVFGSSSNQPIAQLSQPGPDGAPQPPHLDFVQDLTMSTDARRIVSSGFRNVKIWKFSELAGRPAPTLPAGEAIATAMNQLGTHVASLSTSGGVNVGPIGQAAWKWMKAIDVPDSFAGDERPQVHLAVNPAGEAVAVAWAQTVMIVRVDGKEPVALQTPEAVSAVAYDRDGRLIAAGTAGGLHFWTPENDQSPWVIEKVTDKAIAHLLTPTKGENALLTIDAAGKISAIKSNETKPSATKQLPAAATHVACTQHGAALWATLSNGNFGRLDWASGKFEAKTKFDPAAVDSYQRTNWEMLVGERLVAATENELKTAQTNETAEKKNVENAGKDIEAKTKARDDKKKLADDTQKKADDAKAKLTEEQTKEKQTKEKRTQLAEKIKQIDTAAVALQKQQTEAVAASKSLADKIAEMQKQVAAVQADMEKKIAEMNAAMGELTKQKQTSDQQAAAAQKKLTEDQTAKAAADKELKALPADAALAAAVKSATDAFDKAKKDADAKAADLAKAASALELATETKTRAEKRLVASTEEVANRTKLVEQSKAKQEDRKKKDAEVKAAQDQSTGADKALAAIGSGGFLLTQSGTSGHWNLSTATGDWLATLPEIPADATFLGASDPGVLVRLADGSARVFALPEQLWVHERSIGSATEESPFVDRVLALDIDPTGKLLVTGGGEPSRGGELMIWNLQDGSLVRKFENPHTDTVLCARFSPDGKTLATSSADRMIKLWNPENGQLLKTLEGHTHHVNGIAWNVNNRQLSSASADSTVKVWNVETGQATRTITGLAGELTRLVYVGRDDRVGFVSGDQNFRVYRTDNGGRETQAKLADGYLYALATNRDGTKFLVGGAAGLAKIVDKAGKELVKFE